MLYRYSRPTDVQSASKFPQMDYLYGSSLDGSVVRHITFWADGAWCLMDILSAVEFPQFVLWREFTCYLK